MTPEQQALAQQAAMQQMTPQQQAAAQQAAMQQMTPQQQAAAQQAGAMQQMTPEQQAAAQQAAMQQMTPEQRPAAMHQMECNGPRTMVFLSCISVVTMQFVFIDPSQYCHFLGRLNACYPTDCNLSQDLPEDILKNPTFYQQQCVEGSPVEYEAVGNGACITSEGTQPISHPDWTDSSFVCQTACSIDPSCVGWHKPSDGECMLYNEIVSYAGDGLDSEMCFVKTNIDYTPTDLYAVVGLVDRDASGFTFNYQVGNIDTTTGEGNIYWVVTEDDGSGTLQNIFEVISGVNAVSESCKGNMLQEDENIKQVQTSCQLEEGQRYFLWAVIDEDGEGTGASLVTPMGIIIRPTGSLQMESGMQLSAEQRAQIAAAQQAALAPESQSQSATQQLTPEQQAAMAAAMQVQQASAATQQQQAASAGAQLTPEQQQAAMAAAMGRRHLTGRLLQ